MVVLDRFADRQAGFLSYGGEMLFNSFKRFQIHYRGIAERAQVVRDIENRWLRRTVRQWRHGGMKNSHAEFDAFEIAQRRLAAVAVGVEFDGDLSRALKNDRDKTPGSLRREQAADVLEADSPWIACCRFFGFSGVVFVGMTRRDRVYQVGDGIHAGLLQVGNFFFKVSEVVPGVRRSRQGKAIG